MSLFFRCKFHTDLTNPAFLLEIFFPRLFSAPLSYLTWSSKRNFKLFLNQYSEASSKTEVSYLDFSNLGYDGYLEKFCPVYRFFYAGEGRERIGTEQR